MKSLFLNTAPGLLYASVAFAPADAGNAAPAPTPTPVTKPARVSQNDVTRPEAGTVTGALWAIADAESAKLGRPAPRKVVTDAFMREVANANIATANTQYARWVKFYGVADQLKAAAGETKAAKEAEKAQAKAAKAAEAQAKKDAIAKAKADAAAAKEAEKVEKARVAAEAKAKKEAEAKAAADAKAKADAAAAKSAKAQITTQPQPK